MAANQPRCYADLGNEELCMELVAVLGHRCAAHTWVEPPPIQRMPLARVILNPEVPVPENDPPPAPVRPRRRREPPPDERRCVGIKQNGERCACKRKPDSDRCGTHQARVPVQVCTGTRSDGEPCRHPGRFNGLCGIHNRIRIQNEIRESNLAWEPFDLTELRDIINAKKMEQRVRLHRLNVMRRLMALALTPELAAEYNNLEMEYNAIRVQLPRLRTAVRSNLTRLPAEPLVGTPEEIAARARQRVEPLVREFENARVLFRQRVMDLRVGDVHRNNPLAAFANDRQNVHTPETNAMIRNVNIRLQEVSPTVDPLREIAWEWNAANLGTAEQRNRVRADMTHWYREANVSTLNDFAYKNMLDRVWGLINASQHRADMIVRLWEECVDAVGMCAAGHLTRLANAVQGFDESEAPVLEESRSERLQNAMAQISELDPAERESAARRIFAELGVEGDAQRPWLEALEV